MIQSLETIWKNRGIYSDPSLLETGGHPAVIPEGYHCLQEYQEEKARFASIPIVLLAARNLLLFYEALEACGVIYPGSPSRTVFFHKSSGRMIFADAGSVVIEGTQVQPQERLLREAAPEIILGASVHTVETQRWTLAVSLYQLLFHSESPLKGRFSMLQPFYSRDEETRWLAEYAGFTMDEMNWENRPVHGVQDRLIKYWEFYPEVLKVAAATSFVEGKERVASRLSPGVWQQAVNRTRTEYLVCDCGNRGFSHTFLRIEGGHRQCRKCGNTFYVFQNETDHLYLSHGMNVYRHQIHPEEAFSMDVTGQVVENRARKGVFGIKNIGKDVWEGLGRDGQVHLIPPQAGIPLWMGLAVRFPDGKIWRIPSEEGQDVQTLSALFAAAEKEREAARMMQEEQQSETKELSQEEVPTMSQEPPKERKDLDEEIPVMDHEDAEDLTRALTEDSIL